MDGIYSAGREIREKELFDFAHDWARDIIPHGFRGFCKKAVAKSRRISGHNTISPWREFEFYSNCRDASSISSALTLIGLWPIQFTGKPNIDDIDKSIRLLELLLLQRQPNATAESIVEGLMLIEPTREQNEDLINFVRQSSNLSLLDTFDKLKTAPHLWLNNLKPGIFNQNIIQQIN